MNPRILNSGWGVALALFGLILVGLGGQRSTLDPTPRSTSPDVTQAAAVPDSLDEFTHEDHDGLFPLCTGCHIGAETGSLDDMYPAPASCATCHDGETEERVEWEGPPVLQTNLDFDHGEHIRENADEGEDPLLCADCHGDPDPFVLAEPRVEATECLTCHEKPADDEGHYVEAECTLCHVSAASSTLGEVRIAELPTPPDHEADADETFLAAVHGEDAETRGQERCVTCHVRDQCADCHVNAGRVDEIQALPGEPMHTTFPALEARYPTPETHSATRFAWYHTGIAKDDGSNCATCHTSNSCRSCHIEPVPTPVSSLVTRDTVTAPGAEVVADAPESHESVFFMERHGTVASTEENSCATCHEPESFCGSCHEKQAEGGSSYHTPNFLLGHAADAANAVTECATCHDPVAFCRTCHVDAGLQSRGRLGPGYHDAEPLWLLRHPQAARQQLETCASCHTQNDCLQCHSQLGAFGISPHGPGFDARAAYERNPVVCRACHIGDPFGGGGE